MSEADEIPEDLAEKAAVMREFRRLRAAGEAVPAELYARHLLATNDRYKSGPEPGEHIPDFALPDQHRVSRRMADLTGANGLFLVFHGSAEW